MPSDAGSGGSDEGHQVRGGDSMWGRFTRSTSINVLARFAENPDGYITLPEVFGVSRNFPLTYTHRQEVDNRFVSALGQKHHIVVYGSSKQGKTCLRRYNLDDRQHVRITCSNEMDIRRLHEAILKAAGYRIERAQTLTSAGEYKVVAKLDAKFKSSVAEAGTSVEEATAQSEQSATEISPLELDASDVNEIVDALAQIDFDSYIVLEDFHYLPVSTQRSFAIKLKAFHEASDLIFVILGVWLDENRLVQYNGDLIGRLVAVNADRWTRGQLESVIEAGEGLLGIRFHAGFRAYLLDNCFDSVWVVQHVCYRACVTSGIVGERLPNPTTTESASTVGEIGSRETAESLIQEVIGQQTARCDSFIRRMSAHGDEGMRRGFVWIIAAVVSSDPEALEAGLTESEISSFVDQYAGVSGPSRGSLLDALENVVPRQINELEIVPLILDYDSTSRRLNVVDRGFLIWLSGQDRAELLRTVEIPSNAVRSWIGSVVDRGNRHFKPR